MLKKEKILEKIKNTPYYFKFLLIIILFFLFSLFHATTLKNDSNSLPVVCSTTPPNPIPCLSKNDCKYENMTNYCRPASPDDGSKCCWEGKTFCIDGYCRSSSYLGSEESVMFWNLYHR